MAAPALTASQVAPDEAVVIGEFVIGYAVLWLVLTAGAENNTTKEAAAALAVSVAFTATFLYLRDAASNLGLISAGG